MPKPSERKEAYELWLQRHVSGVLVKPLKAAIREEIGETERLLNTLSYSLDAEVNPLWQELRERLWDIGSSLDLIAKEMAGRGQGDKPGSTLATPMSTPRSCNVACTSRRVIFRTRTCDTCC
jgi:hypothetical protein